MGNTLPASLSGGLMVHPGCPFALSNSSPTAVFFYRDETDFNRTIYCIRLTKSHSASSMQRTARASGNGTKTPGIILERCECDDNGVILPLTATSPAQYMRMKKMNSSTLEFDPHNVYRYQNFVFRLLTVYPHTSTGPYTVITLILDRITSSKYVPYIPLSQFRNMNVEGTSISQSPFFSLNSYREHPITVNPNTPFMLPFNSTIIFNGNMYMEWKKTTPSFNSNKNTELIHLTLTYGRRSVSICLPVPEKEMTLQQFSFHDINNMIQSNASKRIMNDDDEKKVMSLGGREGGGGGVELRQLKSGSDYCSLLPYFLTGKTASPSQFVLHILSPIHDPIDIGLAFPCVKLCISALPLQQISMNNKCSFFKGQCQYVLCEDKLVGHSPSSSQKFVESKKERTIPFTEEDIDRMTDAELDAYFGDASPPPISSSSSSSSSLYPSLHPRVNDPDAPSSWPLYPSSSPSSSATASSLRRVVVEYEGRSLLSSAFNTPHMFNVRVEGMAYPKPVEASLHESVCIADTPLILTVTSVDELKQSVEICLSEGEAQPPVIGSNPKKAPTTIEEVVALMNEDRRRARAAKRH